MGVVSLLGWILDDDGLRVELPTDLPEILDDASRIRPVLWNLVFRSFGS